MTANDHIADLLTRLRNGAKAQQRFIEIRCTKMLASIVRVLKENGYIEGFLIREEKPQSLARVYLKYDAKRRPVIQGLKRLSKSSCRRYVGSGRIPRIFGNMGISILSTSQGVMAGHQAKRAGIGGELLCCVW